MKLAFMTGIAMTLNSINVAELRRAQTMIPIEPIRIMLHVTNVTNVTRLKETDMSCIIKGKLISQRFFMSYDQTPCEYHALSILRCGWLWQ